MPEHPETSLQQRLVASSEVCPDCGNPCQIVMQLADPAKATTKMVLTGPPVTAMFVEEAFILCMWCLRRERRTFSSKDPATENSTVRNGLPGGPKKAGKTEIVDGQAKH